MALTKLAETVDTLKTRIAATRFQAQQLAEQQAQTAYLMGKERNENTDTSKRLSEDQAYVARQLGFTDEQFAKAMKL